MSKIKFLIIFLIFFIFKNSVAFSQENICYPSDDLDKLIDKVYLFDENDPQPSIDCSLILIDEHDHLEGYAWLAFFYINGHGLKVDYQKAIDYFEIASQKGDGWSSNYLYDLYTKGIYGDGKIYLKSDYKKAYEYANLAYEQNFF